MSRRSVAGIYVLVLLGVAAPGAASAQAPLQVFLRAAGSRAIDARLAQAEAGAAGSRVDEARAGLLPSVTVTGGYTHNERGVVAEFPDGAGGLTQATISAQNQLDGRAQLDVPLLDLPAWYRFFGAESRAEAARVRSAAAEIDVARATVSAYYRLVAARSLVETSRASSETAAESARVAAVRADAGVGSDLARHRALADQARAEQALAEAELEEALARRELFVLTGLEAGAGRVELADDLAEEAPLRRWVALAGSTRAVEAASAEVQAAGQDLDAAWLALAPTLSAFAAERYSNAAGFGPEFLWSVGVNLRWTLDFGVPAAVTTQEHTVDRARAEQERAQLDAETRIYTAWHQVRGYLARARATRAVERASELASAAARSALSGGTGTALELSQAERDLREARLDRIRADADLVVARLDLRLVSGLPPTRESRP